jgi:hypothetical protein
MNAVMILRVLQMAENFFRAEWFIDISRRGLLCGLHSGTARHREGETLLGA